MNIFDFGSNRLVRVKGRYRFYETRWDDFGNKYFIEIGKSDPLGDEKVPVSIVEHMFDDKEGMVIDDEQLRLEILQKKNERIS